MKVELGDLLVYQCEHWLASGQRTQMEKCLRELFPQAVIIVLDGGAKLSVFSGVNVNKEPELPAESVESLRRWAKAEIDKELQVAESEVGE